MMICTGAVHMSFHKHVYINNVHLHIMHLYIIYLLYIIFMYLYRPIINNEPV